MEWILASSAILAIVALLWAGWIDFKLWILPNELLAFTAIMAIPFHIALQTGLIMPLVGLALGGGSLWLIRAIANKIYGMETIGLGDIKLMAATGLWLGGEGVLIALSSGAFCGVLHAIVWSAHKRFTQGQKVSLNRMMIPAGPGFIIGSILTAFWIYKDLWVWI